ncbi:MAG TPA: aminotransferase class III-fold pyridoxal phosphate-dependent enzyme [archaeon]|nr:aminotransferase class III-fold pyridoxal phosphate-dependent enzyme [archaeon]
MNCEKGTSLWKKAKKLIPGGSQLLSKRSEMFLPDQWPSYYEKAKGVEIWDLDGNHFYDMTIMGVGACILGYADEDVNTAVKNVIEKGSMATLNSPKDVELAELLLNIHPWAEAVRYARTGGEIMAVAVRIGRAYSKKDKIAFCGYHGWHDWYLASNLADNANLDGHLLPGLAPNGVPRGLIKTAIPFEYNKIEKLEAIIKENDIGVIVIEPIRHQEPENNFLQRAREIADETGAVLIFDEITAGWRLTIGGSHLLYNVNPDMMVTAKGISNGYPMAAVIGKAEIMDAAQTSFISSTYWTEAIGPAAAIATIRKMEKYNVPFHLDKIGALIGKKWRELAKKHDLNFSILPPNALVTFTIDYENALAIKTLYTQEMLKRGYLAATSVYVSYAHTEEIVNEYMKNVDEVFELIKNAIDTNKINTLLEGPISHSGFQRLT